MDLERKVKNLVSRVANGEVRAEEEFFDLMYKKLYQVSVAIFHNSSAAEDAVAEFFTKIKSIADKCVNKSNYVNYIYKCQKNICLDITRKEKMRSNINVDISSCDEDVLIQVENADDGLLEYINVHLNELEQKVIIYHYYYGYTYKEISKGFGFSFGKIQRVIAAALKILQNFYTNIDK